MKAKANILLVEDDENLGFILKDYLEMLDYNVNLQKNGLLGLDTFKKNRDSIDLCVLDVMMPYKDGFTLAEDIRSLDENVPIIFLTAKQMKEDRIKGLKLGADDYITKPFSSEELSLRIEAILRRAAKPEDQKDEQDKFEIGLYTLDYANQTLVSSAGEKHLTKKESEVLKLLCLHKNKILRREIALKKIWGEDDYFMGRSMDVYITKLRKYLKDDPKVSITNIHGTGFKLEVEGE